MKIFKPLNKFAHKRLPLFFLIKRIWLVLPKDGWFAKQTSGTDQIAVGSCQSAESGFIVCRVVALNKIDYSM